MGPAWPRARIAVVIKTYLGEKDVNRESAEYLRDIASLIFVRLDLGHTVLLEIMRWSLHTLWKNRIELFGSVWLRLCRTTGMLVDRSR